MAAAGRVVVQNGGYPGLGALDPGSEYGDYAFLRTTLTRLRDGEACGVLSRTWLSTHLYLLGPLNANYVASEGGFARYRAYDAITRGVLGYGLLQSRPKPVFPRCVKIGRAIQKGLRNARPSSWRRPIRRYPARQPTSWLSIRGCWRTYFAIRLATRPLSMASFLTATVRRGQ